MPDQQYPPHQTADSLANTFMACFENKITRMRDGLDEALQNITKHFPDTPLSSCKFDQFQRISLDDLHPVVHQLSKTSCDLNPIPARLLAQSLDILSPVILQIVNLSLDTAFIPPKLKDAILRPILKKQPRLSGVSEFSSNFEPCVSFKSN